MSFCYLFFWQHTIVYSYALPTLSNDPVISGSQLYDPVISGSQLYVYSEHVI